MLTDGEWKLFKSEIIESLNTKNQHFVNKHLKDYYDLSVNFDQQTTGVVKHIFSHRIWHLSIFEGKIFQKVSSKKLPENCEWVSLENSENYAFPRVQEKLWESLQEITLF
ncbi:MAG: NUDIX domain-containing protein, partial [Atopostipes sp.]|nr:NUDIX domain-containing protein [Atopostipes sp.]